MIEKNEMEAYLTFRSAVLSHDAFKQKYIHLLISDDLYKIAYAKLDVARAELLHSIRTNGQLK